MAYDMLTEEVFASMGGRLVELVNRLIRWGIADIADESPDPKVTREEKVLMLLRHQLGQLIVERRALARDLATPSPEAIEMSEKAELAVRKGREDLARAAIAEAGRMTSDRQLQGERIAGLDADIVLLESAIAQLAGHPPATSTGSNATRESLLAELRRLEEADAEAGSPGPSGRRGRDT